jgi:hypothetical protein
VSLYREARSGRRRLWLGVGAALVVVAAVAVAGIVLLRNDEPSAAERLESLQDDVQPALAALELVPIHYESPTPATHAAAAAQLAVASKTVDDHAEELRALDPRATEEVAADLEQLDALVRTTGRTTEVERAARLAAEKLRRLVKLD